LSKKLAADLFSGLPPLFYFFFLIRRRIFGTTAQRIMPMRTRCSEATLIWTVFILISINSPILIVNGFLNAINVEDALAVGELFDRLRS
jgi:uncharacterized membrane protein YwaF